jgi:hypothetical protein
MQYSEVLSYEVSSLLLAFQIEADKAFTGHKHIRPKAIHDKDVVEEFSKDYMYLACIQFVDSVGRLPLIRILS